MAIRVKRHANVSKQATLLDGLDVSPLKWRACGRGLNRFVHEGMYHISNVDAQWKCKYSFMNYKNLIDSYQVHLPVQNASNIEFIRQKCYSYTKLNWHSLIFDIIRSRSVSISFFN